MAKLTVEHPFLGSGSFLAIAHRGGAHERPENSMEAFQYCVELGLRYLETDARVSSDGVVVAFHDELLDRLTDGKGRIEDLPWSELEKLATREGGTIAKMEDLLEAFPQAFFNIDLKSDRAVEPTLDLLEKMSVLSRVCIASFSDRRLRRARRRFGARACTSSSTWEVLRLLGRRHGIPVPDSAGLCVQVPHYWKGLRIVEPNFVETVHRLGHQVHVWTINDEKEMDSLIDLGVDGIVTDRPALLQERLKARGLWRDF